MEFICNKFKICLTDSKISRLLIIATLILQTYMLYRSFVLMYKINSINSNVEENFYRLKKIRNVSDLLAHSQYAANNRNTKLYCSSLFAIDREFLLDSSLSEEISQLKGTKNFKEDLQKEVYKCSKKDFVLSNTNSHLFVKYFKPISDYSFKFSYEKFCVNGMIVTEHLNYLLKKLVIVSAAISCVIYIMLVLIFIYMRKINIEFEKNLNEVLKLKKGIDNTPLPVIITDTEGNIEYVNNSFCETYGYTFEEVIGKNPRIIKSPETPKEIYELLWKTIKSGNKWIGKLKNLTKNGREVIVNAYINPVIDHNGKLVNFLGIHRDITIEQRLIKMLADAKREAEQANEAKSNFLASMSHEIRTPLNAIVGMADLLDEAALSPEHKRYLEILRAASDSLLALVNDILDISKIEAGKVELENIDFNIEELAYKVCEMMSVKAREKNIEVVCRIAPDTPVNLVGDPTRLRQVLINLIGNAIKFVEKGWVSLEIKKIREENGKVCLNFQVSDTGIGIDESKIDKIFDKFSQEDASTTRKYGGTGLGLPISKMLIELMGGKISVKSKKGEGTTFSFDLCFPVSENQKNNFIEKADIKELKGIKVLVIDDNTVNRVIVKEILNAYGAVTVDASSAKDGIEKIKASDEKEPFKIVYMDFNMPEIDGYEAAKIIMQSLDIKNKPKIVISTSDSVRLKKDLFRQIGVEYFLIKPVKKQALIDITLHVLGKTDEKKNELEKKEIVYKKEDLPQLKILIADDSQDNRVLMASFLKGSKVEVEFAEDGVIAVDKFKKGKYDIIFMDMQMPNMDGMAAMLEIRKIEKEQSLQKTPIVALTAVAIKEEVDKAIKAGFDDYLTKPIRKNTFYAYLVNFKK